LIDGKKTIFFGPWVGEFGCELQNCVGQCERIRADHADYYAVMSSYHGREALYKYCDKFLSHPLQTNYDDTGANVSRAEKMVIVNKDVEYYLQCSDIVFRPGDKHELFPLGLGTGFSYDHAKESIKNQIHTRLKAGKNSIGLAQAMTDNENVVAISCRNHGMVPDCNWTEQRWIEIVNRLIDKGFIVVSIQTYSKYKPVHLESFKREGFLNIGAMYQDTINLCEMQIAFLNISSCAIVTTTGAEYLVFKTGTSFVHPYPKRYRDENWCNGAYYSTKLFADLYGCKYELPIGDPTVMEVSADECIAAVERVVAS
jgi:hypothetical protein